MEFLYADAIRAVDSYAQTHLSLPPDVLMARSGEAVAEAVCRLTKAGLVLIFAGPGNNGGDGYAAACLLSETREVVVADVLNAGQKTDAGKLHLRAYREAGGRVCTLAEAVAMLPRAACLVDAVFGTGFHGEIPAELRDLLRRIADLPVPRVAVDVPLGVNADNGELADPHFRADETVVLSFLKPGLVSYPAKEAVGKIVLADLGLPKAEILSHVPPVGDYLDAAWARCALPLRPDASHKGTFGKALVVTGSDAYRGAAFLSLEAALRGGAGYVTFYGEDSLADALLPRFPEALYRRAPLSDLPALLAADAGQSATLIGCGCGASPTVADAVFALLRAEGGTLVLDADAINALAADPRAAADALRTARRPVILTPHPLEFARLTGRSVADVTAHRIDSARTFAADTGTVVVLKGAATVVTDGKTLRVNGSGSSALAKAGSGDVLAGLTVSLAAVGQSPLDAASLAVYLHGAAGDLLAEEYSHAGVTPSDLPKTVAACYANLEKEI